MRAGDGRPAASLDNLAGVLPPVPSFIEVADCEVSAISPNNSLPISVQMALAEMTPARRQAVGRIIDQLLTRIGAVRDVLATPEEPNVTKYTTARRDLEESLAELSDLLGSRSVPAALLEMLTLRPSREIARPSGEWIGFRGFPQQWKKLVKDMAHQARTDLEQLRAWASDPEIIRPPCPTADYCLLSENKVRWKREPIKLPPLLWRILSYLLSRADCQSFPLRDLEERIWRNMDDVTSDRVVSIKGMNSRLSELNNQLEAIEFPWTWHFKKPNVVRAG
jgi:hypothetical protein